MTIILMLLFVYCSTSAQTKKQIIKAFSHPKGVKSIELHCKSLKQYKRKQKRILRILDRTDIMYSFKMSMSKKKSKHYYFIIKYYTDEQIQNLRRYKDRA